MNKECTEVYIDKELFQSIFINTHRFEYTEKLTPFNPKYLEVLLQDALLHHMKQSEGDMDTNVLPLVVKSIIMTDSRNILYLVDEEDKRKVTIPGGHVSSYRMDDFRRGIDFIEFNLIRELCEEFKIGRNSKPYEEMKIAPLREILMRGGFRVVSQGDIMYTLNEKLGFTIYLPIYVEWGTFPDNAIVVYVDDYRKNARKDKLYMYGVPGYESDIRNNECSYILESIVNTKQLFE